MNRVFAGFALATLLTGCSHTSPTISKAIESPSEQHPRFIPAAGNDPYIMFDQETARACWSGPVAGNPADPLGLFSPTAKAEQPAGKFADDGKGLPTCREMIERNTSSGPPPKTADEFLKKYSRP